MSDEKLQLDDVTNMGELVGTLREAARAEFTVWLESLQLLEMKKAEAESPASMTVKITSDHFAVFIEDLAKRLSRAIASMPTNVTAEYRDAAATLDHVRNALDLAGVGAPPRGEEPGVVAAMGVRLRELGAQVLQLSTRKTEITSGGDLDWSGVRKSAKRIGEIASNQVFIAPEATDVHAMRCDEVCREIDAIAGHLKLSRPSL